MSIRRVLSIFLIIAFCFPVAALAVTPADDGSLPKGGPAFRVPNFEDVRNEDLPTDLGEFIKSLFKWSINLVGISVFVMFLYSGLIWFTAAGSAAKIDEARSHMKNAVLGALLLFASYIILYTINPDFVKSTFTLPGLKTSDTPDGVDTSKDPGPVPDDLPNMSGTINAVASRFPDFKKASCNKPSEGGTPEGWQFMDAVVAELRKTDTRWAYNGKRGNVNDPSGDAIAWYYGDGEPTFGSDKIYVVDIVIGICSEGAKPNFLYVGKGGAYVYPRP